MKTSRHIEVLLLAARVLTGCEGFPAERPATDNA